MVLFEAGPHPEQAKPLYGPHLAFIGSQMQTGQIVMAGPFIASGGALAVFSSTDWASLEPVLDADPFVRGGVLKIARHEAWRACEPVR